MIEDVLVGRYFLIGQVLVIEYCIFSLFLCISLISTFKCRFLLVEIQAQGVKIRYLLMQC